MSGSIGLSTAPFTDAEKADIRRFCGYPPYGTGAIGFQGWRFFQAYGLLEFRMNNFAPAEFQVVRQFLAQIYILESAIPGAGANLGTKQAAVWERNPREVADRQALMDSWRRGLCNSCGVPAGPQLGDGSARIVI